MCVHDFCVHAYNSQYVGCQLVIVEDDKPFFAPESETKTFMVSNNKESLFLEYSTRGYIYDRAYHDLNIAST